SQRMPCAPDSTAVVTGRAYRADRGSWSLGEEGAVPQDIIGRRLESDVRNVRPMGNLIPFTFTQIGSVAQYESSTRKGISAFKDVLTRAGIATTVRLNRGRDIQAACGQLAAIGPNDS